MATRSRAAVADTEKNRVPASAVTIRVSPAVATNPSSDIRARPDSPAPFACVQRRPPRQTARAPRPASTPVDDAARARRGPPRARRRRRRAPARGADAAGDAAPGAGSVGPEDSIRGWIPRPDGPPTGGSGPRRVSEDPACPPRAWTTSPSRPVDDRRAPASTVPRIAPCRPPRAPPAHRRAAEPDAACAAAVDLARAAAEEDAEPGTVGEHLGVTAEGERLVTHSFACPREGLPGLALGRHRRPGPARAGRHGLRGRAAAGRRRDPPARLGALAGADRTRRPRPRRRAALPRRRPLPRARLHRHRRRGRGPAQLSGSSASAGSAGALLEGRDGGRRRAGTHGDHGPTAEEAVHAAAPCSTCGFFLPLAGGLRRAFGVCGNEWSPSDGRVVSVDHGCGAHSETDVEAPQPVAAAGADPRRDRRRGRRAAAAAGDRRTCRPSRACRDRACRRARCRRRAAAVPSRPRPVPTAPPTDVSDEDPFGTAPSGRRSSRPGGLARALPRGRERRGGPGARRLPRPGGRRARPERRRRRRPRRGAGPAAAAPDRRAGSIDASPAPRRQHRGPAGRGRRPGAGDPAGQRQAGRRGRRPLRRRLRRRPRASATSRWCSAAAAASGSRPPRVPTRVARGGPAAPGWPTSWSAAAATCPCCACRGPPARTAAAGRLRHRRRPAAARRGRRARPSGRSSRRSTTGCCSRCPR